MSSYRKLGRVVDCKIFDKGRLQMTTNKLFSISNFIFFFFFALLPFGIIEIQKQSILEILS